MEQKFILMYERANESQTASYASALFGIPTENWKQDKEEITLMHKLLGNAQEVYKAMCEQPNLKWRLFKVDELPVRVQPKVYAGGVDIRDFKHEQEKMLPAHKEKTE